MRSGSKFTVHIFAPGTGFRADVVPAVHRQGATMTCSVLQLSAYINDPFRVL